MLKHRGILKTKTETVKVSDKFSKREFIVMAEEQYPKPIKFQLVQANTPLLDPVNIGDEIEVTFALNGRESTKDGKTAHFNSLDAYKIEVIRKTNAPASNFWAMPITTKEATDKIIAYLGKLNEMELGRISSAIKAVRKSRRDKLKGSSELKFKNDTTT